MLPWFIKGSAYLAEVSLSASPYMMSSFENRLAFSASVIYHEKSEPKGSTIPVVRFCTARHISASASLLPEGRPIVFMSFCVKTL
jgi:hypothetical protein